MDGGVSLVAAFGGGIISFLSPCVLPLVPVYLTYLIGDSQEGRARLLLKGCGFILGFSLVFILLGASASVIGSFFKANKTLLREISGVAMIFFGLHMAGILRLKFLYTEKRFEYSPKRGSTLWGAVGFGVVFAAGWTPCIGPVLASILTFAGSVETVNQGVALLGAYSLGLGVPFFLSALLAEGLSGRISRFNKFIPYLSKASGVLLVVIGYLVFNNKLAWLNSYFNFNIGY